MAVEAAIAIIPTTITAISVLLKRLRGAKNNKEQIPLIEEASEKLATLSGAVAIYADAHYQLRDWKTLHDYLGKIQDMLAAPERELDRKDYESFTETWVDVKVQISDLAQKPLKSLPNDWEFETPEGTRTREWRYELRKYRDRLSQAKGVPASLIEIKSLHELLRLLTIVANRHLIELAGELADWSAKLKGKLED